jgi:hypothetical protein
MAKLSIMTEWLADIFILEVLGSFIEKIPVVLLEVSCTFSQPR